MSYNSTSQKIPYKTDTLVYVSKEQKQSVSYNLIYHIPNFSKSFSCSAFHIAMKYANVNPIHKKGK